MKNIFLKETDQESELYYNTHANVYGHSKNVLSMGGWVVNQYMYITNDEPIKMDEPYLGEDGNIYYLCEGGVNSNGKKIVLTNDISLIEDGVQEVSSEFLSFYAENPVDYVEIKRVRKEYVDDQDAYGYDVDYYSLIFPPKEEQKQHIIEMMQNDEELGLYGANIIDQWLEKYGNPEITKQVEREAEQLMFEEAAKKYDGKNAASGVKSFIAGAEWQKNRMYSEEEIKEILFHRETEYLKTNSVLHIDKWFEQFSKLKNS